MNRRRFLGAAAGTLGALSARRVLALGDDIEPIGLQLYSVHVDFTRDPEATLAAVAAIGYRDVALYMLYGPDGWPASRLRGALDRAGLTASAVRVTTPLLYRGLDRHADVAASLGCRYIVCDHIDPEERRALRDWHELASAFNTAGDTARRAGVRIGYHNRHYEFMAVDGHVPYDLLMAETDPTLVRFELNPSSGVDTLGVLRRHSGRFFALDLTNPDAAPLLAPARTAGVEHCYVEIDTVAPAAIDSVRRNFGVLRGSRF